MFWFCLYFFSVDVPPFHVPKQCNADTVAIQQFTHKKNPLTIHLITFALALCKAESKILMKPKKIETETNGRKNDKYKPDLYFTF